MRRYVRPTVRTLGEVLITLGVLLLLFVVYELWFTGVYTKQAQHDLARQLQRQWAAPPTPPSSGTDPSSSPSAAPGVPDVLLGSGFAIIRIPRLGADYHYVVVEGVSHADLKKGPGHYPGTALPGQVGNVVISGHRTTYLAPFNGLAEVRPGDAIVLETADTWYTYTVRREETVLPTDMAVIAPVPEHPGEKPTAAMLTLTTCTPKYSASHRLIVFAELTDTQAKADGEPRALAATGAGG